MRRPPALALLVLLLAAAACGGAEERTDNERAAEPPGPPPTLPAAALPELSARQRALDLEGLAGDASQPAALAELLAEAGFVGGNEREFSGRSRTFDRVVARTLAFSDAEGAERYLGWFEEHAEELVGPVEPAPLEPLGRSAVAFSLVRCGTCKKELPTYLAGWRRGAIVLTLLAAGSGVNERRVSRLARDLDRAVGFRR